MIVNYNTDVSQFWEWSGTGLRPIDETERGLQARGELHHLRADALARGSDWCSARRFGAYARHGGPEGPHYIEMEKRSMRSFCRRSRSARGVRAKTGVGPIGVPLRIDCQINEVNVAGGVSFVSTRNTSSRSRGRRARTPWHTAALCRPCESAPILSTSARLRAGLPRSPRAGMPATETALLLPPENPAASLISSNARSVSPSPHTRFAASTMWPIQNCESHEHGAHRFRWV